MDKANEVIEVSEQEIPFRLLSQEEQQRIIDANQKKCVKLRCFMNGMSGFPHHWLGLSSCWLASSRYCLLGEGICY